MSILPGRELAEGLEEDLFVKEQLAAFWCLGLHFTEHGELEAGGIPPLCYDDLRGRHGTAWCDIRSPRVCITQITALNET